ncbi:MAG: DNA-directed DNA polymerase II small subunit [Nanoarchaeota archaeon]
MEFSQKKKIVNDYIEKGFLVSPCFFEAKDSFPGEIDFGNDFVNDISVLNSDVVGLLSSNIKDFNWREFERLRVFFEKNGNSRPYEALIKYARKKKSESGGREESDVRVTFNYNKENLKKSVNNFVAYFNDRFKELEKILSSRQELSHLTSIGRVKGKKERETVSLIGLVVETSVTANNHIIIKIEDPTGSTNVLISKNNPEAYELAKDVIEDEVIGVTGAGDENIVFANTIVFPDVPLHREIKKSPVEGYAIFLSDIHVGSNTFLEEKFEKFLDWLNGKVGNEKHKSVIEKIKYIFVAGDLVDGVGIFPGQDEELTIPDIYGQYKRCAELFSRIPKHIHVIVCPGNHDAIRLSEPQPPIFKDFTRPLTDLSNLTMVSNPSYINIGATKDFPGFDVLLYHGYSFDYLIANVDNIRNNGGYDRADLVMKYLLQRRHLAPNHKATLYVPDIDGDNLIIKKVPDFFVCGHIHKAAVSSYRGVDLICGSCWQSITKFQEKLGHNPEPARVPLVNLQSRETKILRF